jgi:hypothetical protein
VLAVVLASGAATADLVKTELALLFFGSSFQRKLESSL